jgi:hypothetical protein
VKIDSFEAAITITACPECCADAGEFCKDREGFPILGECHARRTTAHKARVAALGDPSRVLRHIMMHESSVTTVSVRNDEAASNSPKTFHFEITGTSDLTLDEIWPDEEDIPENPTVADVIEKVKEWDNLWSLICEWDLEDTLTLHIADELVRFE